MKLPNCEIEHATADNDVRMYLNEAHFDREGSRLLASNGMIVAVVPVTDLDDEDHTGPIPAAALKAARKAAGKKFDRVIVANGSVKVPLAGLTFDREEKGKYPDVDRVINAAPGPIAVTLNAGLLYDLARALTDRNQPPVVTLRLGTTNSTPIRVEPVCGDVEGRVGMIATSRAHSADDDASLYRASEKASQNDHLRDALRRCRDVLKDCEKRVPEGFSDGIRHTCQHVDELLASFKA